MEKPTKDVCMWADECGVGMFKVATSYGDPVERFDCEAEQVIADLHRTLERLQAVGGRQWRRSLSFLLHALAVNNPE